MPLRSSSRAITDSLLIIVYLGKCASQAPHELIVGMGLGEMLHRYLGRPPFILTMVYAGMLLVAWPLLLSVTYPHYSWGPGRAAWNITGIGPLLIGFRS